MKFRNTPHNTRPSRQPFFSTIKEKRDGTEKQQVHIVSSFTDLKKSPYTNHLYNHA